MKKIITYGIITCLVVSTLIGCGKKEENTANSGPVIIQAGDSAVDSAVGSGGRKDTSSAETTDGTSNNETASTKNTNSSEIVEEDDSNSTINLVGVWLSNKGNCLEFRETQFTAYLNGKDIGGDYIITGDNELTLSYAVKTEIEDATEEQKLLGTNFNIETISTTYSVQSYNEQTNFILALGNNKEVYTYFGDVAAVPDDAGSEITDAEELEALNQELEANGINPETGLSFENEAKLIEMGIDPATGLPLEIENTEEADETATDIEK